MINHELVATYRSVKESPDELIDILRKQQDRYRACKSEEDRKSFYLAERERYNKRGLRDVEVAALFIFLNRTCFNGLYRVNSKGLFNVPFGKSVNPLICDEDTIRADSKLLQKVEILNGDFEQVEKTLGKNAFVYFDPPYRPLTQTASFTAYAKDGFNDDEQKRLAAFCRRLDKNGHQWLLSNSDPHNADPSDMFFEEIYSGFDINRVYDDDDDGDELDVEIDRKLNVAITRSQERFYLVGNERVLNNLRAYGDLLCWITDRSGFCEHDAVESF